MAQISLDEKQAALLLAVARGEVHHDPRYTKPDFRRDPDRPALTRRAGRDLAPLKKWQLVELVDEKDRHGVRLYKLTERGEQVSERLREQETTALAEPDAVEARGGDGRA